MNPMQTARRQITMALLLAAAGGVRAAEGVGSPNAAFMQFDAVYIPALFLTGSAGKSSDAAAKAREAMQRLVQRWPASRRALEAAVADRRRWPQALQAVQAHLRDAEAQVAQAQWATAHETLEHVREVLFEARRALGIDHALDDFTAYHAVMEKLSDPKGAGRPALEVDFATARALWRRIEAMSFEAPAFGLDPARARQLAQARNDESAALSALSQALREGSDAELQKAAAAIKPPFVRAYVAFGAPP